MAAASIAKVARQPYAVPTCRRMNNEQQTSQAVQTAVAQKHGQMRRMHALSKCVCAALQPP
jgi:hypothetical protein